ncbi:HAMP domain-containing histidine kinase (plasmid) [Hymenobacter sp. NBH84]|uniref:histidine kinase n=1 Tax=Hymenobacter citatus TaxID=2763506 RepID=A0ABR7MQ62_9BACT|nr:MULTISPECIES: HAMP domain-containing sensor histidine kinase [Hymenobacter]MBC6613221.1 HAMP domain-containing histidine kinase [Hymenobacter citatus]QNE41926.1 HAMP domain-containing histidine kinase [Hymenobacter sp. NBH84]
MLIRNKLMVRFTLLALGIQLCFSACVYYFNATMRAQRFQHRLVNSATLAGRLLVPRLAPETNRLRGLRREVLLTLPHEEISLYGPDTTLRYSSADHIDQAANRRRLASVGAGQLVRYPTTGALETIGFAYPQGRAQGYYRIFVSAEDQVGRAQQRQLGRLLLLANSGALLLTLAAAWLFASGALRPFARISQQAQRISASSLQLRLAEGNGRDELAQLARDFNTMLAGLEQAFEAQKSFLSNASHELRTPLTGLVGTLETALEYDTTLFDARQSMTQSLEAARRLSALTNGLLNLAKVDGALPAATPVRLDECLRHALALARAKYPNREWHLSFRNVPTGPEAHLFMLTGNAELLTTALLNLLDNAGKYSGGPVRTEVMYADATTLRLAVADEGPGLSAEELSHIYEPLYRSAGAQGRPGYGLGLPLTQRIIQRHGGRLELTSVPNQGTVAEVWLPIHPS